jgi:signal transduction histidine kinase
LQDKDHALGILSVYGKASDTESVDESFDEDDIRLLQTMTGNISRALARAIHHQEIESLVAEKEAMVRELSILHATSAAMMKTTHMERLLRVILMAITLGDGLGFNRAMLFLVDEDKGVLEGKTGVGPSSAQDAVRIWTNVNIESRSLSEWLDWTLEQSEWSGEESPVHRVAKRIRVPLGEERCVLIQALQKKKAIRDLFSERLFGLEKMKQLELGEQFACVPVIARDEALGVILVDNMYSSKPISDKDVNFLTTFASQAGLGIQNAMLYENLKRANEELQIIQQRLIHSERLVTLGEFSASMAHEIRNPLVSIGGYARLLQKKHRDSYSKIIYEEVARLEEILNRILTFSRKATPMERENVDVNQLIDESLRTLREEIRLSRAKIEKELSQSLPQVYCDKGQIKQVFLNLVQNALEAMERQGTLTVRTHVASDENGLWVIAEVSDTGEGIPGDVLQNIFNPFFTTKGKGTGLGLPIIQRFVEAHNGKIEVDNHPGEGSTFRVKLLASF